MFSPPDELVAMFALGAGVACAGLVAAGLADLARLNKHSNRA